MKHDHQAVYQCMVDADKGCPEAQYELGDMYHWGNGMPKDLAEAARWYRLAAEQGHTDAQRRLGHMYSKGLGTPKNDDEALRWYKLAADNVEL